MSPDIYRKNVENQMLVIIKNLLDTGRLTADRTKEIAQFVLQVLPQGITIPQVNDAVLAITQKYPEFKGLNISAKKDLEENTKQTALPQIHELLTQGNIEAAHEILKKAMQDNAPANQNHG